MADSIREQIVLEFKALMQTITTANGYDNDLGLNVKRGITRPLEKDELPGLIINEGKETSDSNITAGFDHHRLPIDISARAVYPDGNDWYKASNTLLADIVKAMGTNSNLSDKAIDIVLDSNQTGIDDGDKHIAGADINIRIHYRTKHLDPYN